MQIDNILGDFCDVTGADPDAVEDRWAGRPDHIIEDLFRLKTEDGTYHPVRLFDPWQRQFVHAYFYGDSSVLNLLKGRRIGGTAIALMCFTLEGMIMPNQRYPLVSTKEEQAYSRISDITELLENAVIDIPHDPLKGQITLWNGTKFIAYTKSAGGSRGDGARSILFDEMAFMGPPYEETQKELLRAFREMLALSSGKMVQVSTPNLPNDVFMRTNARGTMSGYDDDGNKIGVISFFQPTFHNADEIDIEVSLHEQHLEPARPDLNIDIPEAARQEDPMGFRQEYLCVPAAEEHLFFSASSIDDAMKRSRSDPKAAGIYTVKTNGLRFGFLDIGVKNDDTVLAVADHYDTGRYLRYIEVVKNDTIALSGVPNPDRENIDHVATRVADVCDEMGVDMLMLDVTGAGQFAPSALRKRLGSRVIPFNFSATKDVRDAFAGMNRGLRSGEVSLVEDRKLAEQLKSIVRIQKKDSSVPKFSGKDTAPEGKDDMAVATVMALYPPGYSDEKNTEIAEKQYSNAEQVEDKTAAFRNSQRSSTNRGAAYSSTTISRAAVERRYRARYSR
jgi:hypothetical protein